MTTGTIGALAAPTPIPTTPRQMRKAVRGWLKEENATIAQALALESAIYAGAIAGSTYSGERLYDEEVEKMVDAIAQKQRDEGTEPEKPYRSDWGPDFDCGCLLDTFERIRGRRPWKRPIRCTYTGQAFSLALFLGLGDTPSNSPWARAAVRGIRDYVAEVEAAAERRHSRH